MTDGIFLLDCPDLNKIGLWLNHDSFLNFGSNSDSASGEKTKKENNILTLFSFCKHMTEFDW